MLEVFFFYSIEGTFQVKCLVFVHLEIDCKQLPAATYKDSAASTTLLAPKNAERPMKLAIQPLNARMCVCS